MKLKIGLVEVLPTGNKGFVVLDADKTWPNETPIRVGYVKTIPESGLTSKLIRDLYDEATLDGHTDNAVAVVHQDDFDFLAKNQPTAEEQILAWKNWFKASGGEYWNTVEDIEAELRGDDDEVLDTVDPKMYSSNADVEVENTAGIAGINARGVRSEVRTDDEPRSSMLEQYNTDEAKSAAKGIFTDPPEAFGKGRQMTYCECGACFPVEESCKTLGCKQDKR